MKQRTVVFALLLAFAAALCACSPQKAHAHEDGDRNGLCDICGEKMAENTNGLSVTFADMRDLHTVRFGLNKGALSEIGESDVRLLSDGAAVPFTELKKISAMQAELCFGRPLDVSGNYRLLVKDLPPAPVFPTTYFGTEEFERNYAYDGPLGVELTPAQTCFRLWAPTASAVLLNLYDAGNGGSAVKTVGMDRAARGVWEHTEGENLSGSYYTYTVTTAAGTAEAVDPYAVSAGLNGERGMILDLATTDPQDKESAPFVPAGAENGKFNYTDAEIWEVHIRDFSQNLGQSNYKGKFLAFTERGLKNRSGAPVGVDYLKDLGITHVHLLPAFDYASVDESGDGFNWGYDPQNYNVPEGSYSTDPTRGEVRVKEFKQMVRSLHEAGIGVVMDVVYNHTYSLDSNFNRIVPTYYYRYLQSGKPSDGSGCGNETASEHAMFRRFMIDSVTYWLKEYNVDGFRFDLMGLHDVETMQQIERAVHGINPNAILYGEGWTGGSTPLATERQAVLANLQEVNKETQTNGVAMFNDALRDALKGSADGKDVGFATGGEESLLGGVLFGAIGGRENAAGASNQKGAWSAYNGTNIVNYASAHDNLTLWDKICSAYGEEAETLGARLRRNRLCAAIVQTSLGIPFLQAGEEMLRSKKNADGSYNANSYNAGDALNNLKWELLGGGSAQEETARYYRGLIALRKKSKVLRDPAAEAVEIKTDGTLVSYVLRAPGTDETLFLVWNAGEEERRAALPEGRWSLFADGDRAGDVPLAEGLSGSISVAGVSCYVFLK